MSRAVPSSPDIATAVRSARFQAGECQAGHTIQPGIRWQAGVDGGQKAPVPTLWMRGLLPKPGPLLPRLKQGNPVSRPGQVRGWPATAQ